MGNNRHYQDMIQCLLQEIQQLEVMNLLYIIHTKRCLDIWCTLLNKKQLALEALYRIQLYNNGKISNHNHNQLQLVITVLLQLQRLPTQMLRQRTHQLHLHQLKAHHHSDKIIKYAAYQVAIHHFGFVTTIISNIHH